MEFSDIAAGVRSYPENEINKNADYVIGVNGNSMEPEYSDGDIVYVKKTEHLNVGDIGSGSGLLRSFSQLLIELCFADIRLANCFWVIFFEVILYIIFFCTIIV